MKTEPNIRIGTIADLDLYVEHTLRFTLENGKDGIYFSPHPPTHQRDPLKMKAEVATRWTRELAVPGWERTFLAFFEGRVIGHLDLKRGDILPTAHRLSLGMALEYAYKGQGLGTTLMQTAIEFARGLAGIDWIDLGVFADNHPAKKLYDRFGFVETGRILDMFRVGEHSVND